VVRLVVLAAGESKRMGAPKALLPDGAGRLFITRVLHTFCAAGLTDLTVVTGTLHEPIVRAVAADPPRAVVRFARNPDPGRGQLSSVLTGLDEADAPGVSAILLTLVDVPFVATATVRTVVDAFERTRAPIVRPMARRSGEAAEAGVRDDRHGHPVLFARSLFDELRRADPALGAKAVVRAHATRILNLEIDDEGALLDLDTHDEYERAVRSS